MHRTLRLVLAAALAVPFLASAALAQQDRAQTLADIRQEMSVLYVEIQKLKQELNTTGAPSGGVAGGSVLDRVNLIEQALRDLTSKTEQLQFRVDQVVTDGTNRIGDLEFRLCELETDCDIGSLGDTPSLGGETSPVIASPIAPLQQGQIDGGAQLAVGERADFDAAKAAYDAGDFDAAAQQFGAFTDTYTGGPLTGEAYFFRGSALAQSGQTSAAARAYLESFSGYPNGPRAADALLGLGRSLGALGQTNEACVTLGEVSLRYPNSAAVTEASAALQALGCQSQ
ncbi:tol-pal system protein YbgF [Anianabacter salinae]|uniref:tol-pal system protein YbgF n=1 Tax=Anianabacter salinae TaxID=2851023 RepID=UPI00225DD9EE|nr:tol-pal system protein YbgF [Anianabacter salinae]MBV0911269.1 tol-pal system protein YbgF [Anianabacter salinae]